MRCHGRFWPIASIRGQRKGGRAQQQGGDRDADGTSERHGLSPCPRPARRDFDDALEFAPLVLFRNHQVIEAAEAALRAERELLDRTDAGLASSIRRFKRSNGSKSGRLVVTRPSTATGPLPHMFEGRKAAGPLVIVFQQQAVMLELWRTAARRCRHRCLRDAIAA